jgi:hypothetical protein
MMKQLVFAGMVVALAGCVQVDRYEDVVKAPRRQAWKATGRRKGRRVR